jgi:hypothetical protein
MEKLPLIKRIQPYLDDLRDRKVTGRFVATELQVSEQHLSRTLARLEIKRVPGKRNKQDQELKATRKAFRELAATTLPLNKAAQAAHCHPRTIKRILTRLKG